MSQQELDNLKLDIFKLYGKSRGREIMSVYRRVLDLISHTESLHRTMRKLRDIGGQQTL